MYTNVQCIQMYIVYKCRPTQPHPSPLHRCYSRRLRPTVYKLQPPPPSRGNMLFNIKITLQRSNNKFAKEQQ